MQKARIWPHAAFSVTDWTAFVLFIVIIGGIATIEGPVVGVLIFWLLQDQLAAFGGWYLMILGALAVCVMLFFPEGVWGALAHRYHIHLFSVPTTSRRQRRQAGDMTKARRRSRGARDEEPAIVLSVGAGGRLVAVLGVVGATIIGAQPSRPALMAGFHAQQRHRTAIASTTEP